MANRQTLGSHVNGLFNSGCITIDEKIRLIQMIMSTDEDRQVANELILNLRRAQLREYYNTLSEHSKEVFAVMGWYMLDEPRISHRITGPEIIDRIQLNNVVWAIDECRKMNRQLKM